MPLANPSRDGTGVTGAIVVGGEIPLGETEFAWFQSAMRRLVGIDLGPHKRGLVASRLRRRVLDLGCRGFSDYVALLDGDAGQAGELQIMVDLLTTNETYFFREPIHFDFIASHFADWPDGRRPLRVWSAASSSGEEAYTVAMVLAETLGPEGWEIVATDVSQRVLARARTGLYPLERARKLPQDYLVRYCLKGTGPQSGRLLIDRALRSRVAFEYLNLNDPLPNIGRFHLIMLRNMLIYCDRPTKGRIIERVLERLDPGGIFIIGQSETLHGFSHRLAMLRPSIYQVTG